ncbi:polysaccharide deacetylase family protein [Streptomyces echinoruber]|uniref:Polysaccharide deacetylase familiy protein n=1 Tax=Streptomyces echinoruber TaxID=68898 RepID=A0A918VLA8_9ACTN|nr:polysaccharide deacetylase familiy protein [Streptomyces echinoruber]
MNRRSARPGSTATTPGPVRPAGAPPVRVRPAAAAVLLPCTAAVAAVAAAHLVPAATWLPRLRAACFPRLAGLGHPRHVALTFDDGPDPATTPRFLDALDDLGVRATFFVLGESVVRHPGLTREIAGRGHELAVHGWTHGRPWLPAPARDLRETELAGRVVHDTTGRRPRWYRPPYGILTSGRWAAARRAGLRPVLWTAWGRDWTADATPASVRAAVGADLRGGGTILLHDTDRTAAPGCWRAALGALPGLVRDCREAGWEVGPLAEHGVGARAER